MPSALTQIDVGFDRAPVGAASPKLTALRLIFERVQSIACRARQKPQEHALARAREDECDQVAELMLNAWKLANTQVTTLVLAWHSEGRLAGCPGRFSDAHGSGPARRTREPTDTAILHAGVTACLRCATS